MKVLHVITAMFHGGAERLVVDLASVHAEQGFQVAIVAPPGPLDRDWAPLGVDRFLVPAAGRRPTELLRTAHAVRSALTAWKPDVVHAHNVKATGLALTAARGRPTRTPVVSTMHGVREADLGASARVLRFADQVATVSDALRRGLVARGLPSDHVRVIYNGVTEVAPLSADEREQFDRELALRGAVVAAVGRLAPEKAQDRLLGAAASVLASRPETTFLLVGDGSLRGELERLAGELGIDSAVRFTGVRDDARRLIARADVLVVCSKSEGLPMAALEALAARTPVVSTDLPGMRELLSTGGGTIINGSDPTVLAAAITELLDDPGRREAMGEAGQRLVADRFSAQAMRVAYAELYSELLAGSRGA